MYDVSVRTIPARTLLSTMENLTADEIGAFATPLYAEFGGPAVPRPEGDAGRPFLRYSTPRCTAPSATSSSPLSPDRSTSESRLSSRRRRTSPGPPDCRYFYGPGPRRPICNVRPCMLG